MNLKRHQLTIPAETFLEQELDVLEMHENPFG